MSVQSRLADLITAIGADVKSHQTQIDSIQKVLILNAADSVPGGTPAGTVILRRP